MRYLVRGGMNLLTDDFSVNEILTRDLFGDNSGNMLYLLGVFCTLLNGPDDMVDVDHYKVEREGFSDAEMERINAEYDAYVLPLADAFRDGFKNSLLKYEKFFGGLKIPLVIPGVGLRAPFEPDYEAGFPFDEEVRRFVKAALEHTSCLGLRGELTGKYLKSLGFREDRDYQVIGCPSMYTLGKELPMRPLDPERLDTAKIVFNYNSLMPEASIRFLVGLKDHYENAYFVGQTMIEAKAFYYGIPYEAKEKPHLRPRSMDHPFIRDDRFRFFVDPMAWMDFMRECSLSIGGRFHGSVSAVLAGCPVIYFPADARTRELAEYHSLPMVRAMDVREDMRLEDIIASVNLDSHLKRQGENLERYLAFLRRQGIANAGNYAWSRQIFDELRSRPRKFLDNVLYTPQKAVAEREIQYFSALMSQERAKAKKAESKAKVLEAENTRLKKQLNRRSVRLALKSAEIIKRLTGKKG